MLISGVAGVGKSSLIHELQSPVIARGGRFIAGKFVALQREIPCAAFVDAFRELVLDLLAESDERITEYRSRISASLGNNAGLVHRLVPELGLILRDQPPALELPPAEIEKRLRGALRRFVAAFATSYRNAPRPRRRSADWRRRPRHVLRTPRDGHSPSSGNGVGLVNSPLAVSFPRWRLGLPSFRKSEYPTPLGATFSTIGSTPDAVARTQVSIVKSGSLVRELCLSATAQKRGGRHQRPTASQNRGIPHRCHSTSARPQTLKATRAACARDAHG